jgi:hypothetical protein
VHEQKVELADVVDEESLVARRHHVARLLVGSVTDLGHDGLSLEATAHGIINTLGLSPAGVHAHEAVRLVAVEARSACLFHHCQPSCSSCSCYSSRIGSIMTALCSLGVW